MFYDYLVLESGIKILHSTINTANSQSEFLYMQNVY